MDDSAGALPDAPGGDDAGRPPKASGPPSLTPGARLLLRLSPVAALPFLVGLLLFGAPLSDVLILPVVLGTLPVLAVVQALVLDQVEIEKLPAYVSTMVSIGLLALVCGAAGAFSLGWEGLGLVLLPWPELVGWSLLLTALGLALMGLFRLFAGRFGLAEHPVLRTLLPETGTEKATFVGVSLSAGVGEELVFRGYAIGALAPFLGVGGAVALSTASFGVVHAYQGALGFVRTAALGGLLAWGYLASGSLLPAMAAHTLLDIVAGIFLAERFMVPDPPSRV